MAKKLDREEIDQILEAFITASYEKYESHSFAAGYLKSSLMRLLETVPAHKQKEVIAVVKASTEQCK